MSFRGETYEIPHRLREGDSSWMLGYVIMRRHKIVARLKEIVASDGSKRWMLCGRTIQLKLENLWTFDPRREAIGEPMQIQPW